MRKRGHADDRGSASVWAAGGIASVLVLVALIVGFGSAVATRHRATSAADLAALAAAAHATSGAAQACARARWVTDRMGVALTSCRLRGWDALVEVTARPPALIAGFGSATAHARAGPTNGDPSLVERSFHAGERLSGSPLNQRTVHQHRYRAWSNVCAAQSPTHDQVPRGGPPNANTPQAPRDRPAGLRRPARGRSARPVRGGHSPCQGDQLSTATFSAVLSGR